MKLVFQELAWEHYTYWQATDAKMVKRVNLLIKDCLRDPFNGIGKAEPLKQNLSGWWSRRIDAKHRLVYRVYDGALEIAQCRFHY